MRKCENSDWSEIVGWLKARNVAHNARPVLPSIGFIEPGVCAGFLCLIESGSALLEGFVTNPEATSSERGKGISELTEALLAEAVKNGVRHVVALCEDPTIETRAIERGFKFNKVVTMLSMEL